MTRARGRSRFIRREMVFGLVIWLFVVPFMDVFGAYGDHWHSISLQQHILNLAHHAFYLSAGRVFDC